MTLSQLNRPIATLTLNSAVAAQRAKIEKAAASKSMDNNNGDGKQHLKPSKKLSDEFGKAMQKAMVNGIKKPSENPTEKARLKQKLQHSADLSKLAMNYKLNNN